MGEHRGTRGDERRAVLADAAAHLPVLFQDRRRLGAQPRPQVAIRRVRHRARHPQQTIDRPAQVGARRPRRPDASRGFCQPGAELGGWQAQVRLERSDEPDGTRHPDGRGAPHPQAADRLDDVVHLDEVDLLVLARQQRLIDDSEGVVVPADGTGDLNRHDQRRSQAREVRAFCVRSSARSRRPKA